MSVTVYKNARIFIGDGAVVENGIVAVSHKQTEFVMPKEGEVPAKIANSVADKLDYVGPAADYSVPEDAEVIDLEGYTVLPGLIDCAARLDTLKKESDDYVDNIGIAYRTILAYRSAAEALNVGVTTVRAVGMPNNIDIALKTAVSKTMFFGPAVLAAGPTYAITAGFGHESYGLVMASGCDELRRAMRVHISRGLDGVTLQVSGEPLPTLNGEYWQQMSTTEVNALVKHAAGAEKKVMCVANGDPSVGTSINAGAAVILEGRRIGADNLKAMAEKGVGYVPCLVNTLGTEFEAEHKAVVAEAVKAGVKIGVGTEILPSEPCGDTVAYIREMELLAECGMEPAQVLKAATSGAAAITGSKAGLLAAGKAPDFIAVKGKPDEDISAMRNVALVVKSGRRAFNRANGAKEMAFQIMAPGYEVKGGTTMDWACGATQGVIMPPNYNDTLNLTKEI